MRWLKLVQRYALVKKPTLKVVNPRVGTSIIPLDQGDGDIFLQYLTDKVHALHFEGSEKQLIRMIEQIREKQGVSVHKMRTSLGRGRERLMLLHLKFPNQVEVRRLIKIS